MDRDQFWLDEGQFARLAPHLPTDTRGKPKVDDRRVISGIVPVLKSGGRWVDAPAICGPKKDAVQSLRALGDQRDAQLFPRPPMIRSPASKRSYSVRSCAALASLATSWSALSAPLSAVGCSVLKCARHCYWRASLEQSSARP